MKTQKTKYVLLVLQTLTLLFVLVQVTSCAVRQRESVEQEVFKEQRVREILAKVVDALRDNSVNGNETAQALLKLAYQLNSNDVRVLDGFGCVAWRNNELELAKHYFVRAIELDPKYDRAYAHLSLVAEKRGDLTAARELLELALFLNPLNYRARNNYAVLLGNLAAPVQSREQHLQAYFGAQDIDHVLLYNRSKMPQID